MEELEVDIAHDTPVWAIFGDLMSGLVGVFVLILVWVLGYQLELAQSLANEVSMREVEQQRLYVLEGELETALRMKAGVTILVVNNAASGYVKALQHSMYGTGNYQSSDLMDTNYANVANAFGCHGIRVEDPEELGGAIRSGLAETERPTVIDVVVTRDPAKMLPAIDSRVLKVEKGDRPI